ncbi:DUF2334 domain-containing protein [Bacillus tuaregi]|uniref:DUF2334 domain-containing protein n=1 Tax=Bacillus tuaregi TaxID=1816695 RepID=UPI0008F7EBF1|nr:polysaccharide deacetylase family protein [Bacillus tuaregi]
MIYRPMKVQMIPWVLIICLTLFIFFSYTPSSKADEKESPKVLVIYTSQDGEINEYQRYLDLIVSHFSNDVTFISSDKVVKEDLTAVTHLFYYGQVAQQLSPEFSTLFDGFTGNFVAIGYNTEQFGQIFSFVHPTDGAEINQLYKIGPNEKPMEVYEQYILGVQPDSGTEVLLEGKSLSTNMTYPVLIKNQKNYFYAIEDIYSENSILLGEMLHDVFQTTNHSSHPGYIRLEDVHPLVDPKPLGEIAEILKQKNIPYMIAVIPIYTNPETGEKHTFADSPKLLKVLKEMQKNGGSIVLHGYTHQYRASETGEGFEFWDVDNNSPIYSPTNEPYSVKKESDFSSKAEYESYIADLKKFETKYIEEKIKSGIHELTKYGLYPLAFEAPHYTMSQNGYKILANHFSTYVGQVQLSDKDWEIMNSTPYITEPTFFHGMQLLPETMGYVKPRDPEAIQTMLDKAELHSYTKDGMFAAFYHPYLGSEGFNKLIVEMEKLPISWIDLKQMDNWVKVDNVTIHTENGEILVEMDKGKVFWSSMDAPLFYFKEFINKVVWGMAALGGAAVIAFIIFTIYLKGRKKQIEG